MYQVIYDEIDGYSGEVRKRDCVCYTKKNIEVIKQSIEKYLDTDIEIRSIAEKRGIIV
jgi:hypothetical protein